MFFFELVSLTTFFRPLGKKSSIGIPFSGIPLWGLISKCPSTYIFFVSASLVKIMSDPKGKKLSYFFIWFWSLLSTISTVSWRAENRSFWVDLLSMCTFEGLYSPQYVHAKLSFNLHPWQKPFQEADTNNQGVKRVREGKDNTCVSLSMPALHNFITDRHDNSRVWNGYQNLTFQNPIIIIPRFQNPTFQNPKSQIQLSYFCLHEGG